MSNFTAAALPIMHANGKDEDTPQEVIDQAVAVLHDLIDRFGQQIEAIYTEQQCKGETTKRFKAVRNAMPDNYIDLYCRRASASKPNPQNYLSAPKIGMGLESAFKPQRVAKADVHLDKHTQSDGQRDKHILYAAGWSLNDDSD